MRTAANFSTMACVLMALFLTGCGSSPPAKTAKPSGTSSNAPPPPPAPVQPPVVSAPALGSPPANTAAVPPAVAASPVTPPAVAPPVAVPPVANPPVAIQPAPVAPAPGGPQVKLGDAGKKDFGGPAIVKPITAPVQVLLSVKWRTKDIEIQHALQIYKAEHEHGPKTEKEFFDGVIKANQIDLPKLQPGERYVFNVEEQQLMVEQPGR